MLDPTTCYAAFAKRDPKSDGAFYVAVTSTRIYCRPICTARLPKPSNCRFYHKAAEAEAAGFRACLRCRPELAPGYAPIDDAKRIAYMLTARIAEDKFDSEKGIEGLADQFQLSTRQLRRIVKKELGVSLTTLLQNHRLQRAKQLLMDTDMPITRIAFTSGFGSLRRFNDAFRKEYGKAPSAMRKSA